MKKKYLLYPGCIQSEQDGEIHYISAKQLIDLYKVNPAECLIHSVWTFGAPDKSLIILEPDYRGNYEVPS